jgi:AmpD protein
MKINLETGLLEPVTLRPSPNFNPRPANTDIRLLVIHNISLPPGVYGTDCIEDFFCNRLDHNADPYFSQLIGMEVSAHLLIRRDGALVQFVPFHQRAWHAGASSFCGIENCNDFSIGIELEGSDDEAYEAVQYSRLAQVSALIMQAWPAIGSENIVGHSDIAPGRKTDPGPAFDWATFRMRLEQEQQ